MRTVSFLDLQAADLEVGTTYECGEGGALGGEPINRLIVVGNRGGIRPRNIRDSDGNAVPGRIAYVALFMTGLVPEWPDRYDVETQTLIYYGDNRKPGKDILHTSRRGNIALKNAFESATADRAGVAPFFVFERVSGSRDVMFLGCAVPGSRHVPSGEDLTVEWNVSDGEPFRNYRGVFTVLGCQSISRSWINNLQAGFSAGLSAPREWMDWIRA